MALNPRLTACDSIQSIVLYDTTGAFNRSNPDGYGGPNPNISDIISYMLEVTDHSTGKTTQKQLYPTFPTVDGKKPFTLFPLDIGNTGNSIKSSFYTFKVTLTGPSIIPVTNSFDFVFTKSAQFEVDQLRTKSLLHVPGSEIVKYSQDLSTQMERAIWARACGAPFAANTILKYVNNQLRCCVI